MLHGTKEIPKPTKEQTIEATNQLKACSKQLEFKINPLPIKNKEAIIEEIRSIPNLDLSPENLKRGSHLGTITQIVQKIGKRIMANPSIDQEKENEIHNLLAEIRGCVDTLKKASPWVNTFRG